MTCPFYAESHQDAWSYDFGSSDLTSIFLNKNNNHSFTKSNLFTPANGAGRDGFLNGF